MNNYQEDRAVAANINVKERDFWLNRLAGEIEKTSFFYDYNRVEGEDRCMERLSITISGEVTGKLMILANHSDHTLHVILAAGLVVLLHKYTRSDDIIIGTPIYKQTIKGNFINTVIPLRSHLSLSMTFKELLVQVKTTLLEGIEHQNYPLDALLSKLNMKKSPTDFPLFDVIVLLENIHDPEYIDDIKTNMVFLFSRKGDTLDLVIEYNGVLYDRSTVQRISNHFMILFRSLLESIDAVVSQSSILTNEEKKRILEEFNARRLGIDKDRAYNRLFHDRAIRYSSHVAAEYNGRHITYQELNKEADCIKRRLQGMGVKPGTYVPIYINRSIKMLASIIGVFKAGAGYLPLEVDYPDERIKDILGDSESPLLITGVDYLDAVEQFKLHLPGLNEVLVLNHHDEPEPHCSRSHPVTVDSEEQSLDDTQRVAYIIYTSGTTGKPKGAMVNQLGMMNHHLAKVQDLGLNYRDIIAHTGSAGFDVSVWQFLAVLLVGGRDCIVDRRIVLEPVDLLRMLQKRCVTVLELVPSFITTFLDLIKNESSIGMNHLRWLIPTGEPLTVALVRKWNSAYPNVKLMNAYGPTEAADNITHYIIEDLPSEKQKTIPVGRPLYNTNVFVMDPQLRLCPVGVRGEICVAGFGVGNGYLNDREKTEKAFVANPYLEETGDPVFKRLYKTGDLGYFREDGNIECLGRLDFQVKIRGNRIELGEIESVLARHERIKEVVVLAREDTGGNKYLCSYIVWNTNEEADIPALRDYLYQRLPDFMVPSYFIKIDRLPLNPNGKVNRRALPEPDFTLTSLDQYVAPRDHLEKRLVEIWADVLALDKERISIDDNFFAMGGHSLRATIMAARVHEEFSVKILLSEFFKKPFIRALAESMFSAKKERFSVISPVEEKDYYELTPAQKRLFFIQQMDETSITYNILVMNTLAVQTDSRQLENSFKTLIQRHESLRTSFHQVNDRPVQVIHPWVNFCIEYWETGKEEGRDLIANFIRPFNLGQAPLLRVGLLRFADGCMLLVDIHHIISDGVSGVVLIEDFLEIYQGHELMPPILQYKDYAEWLNQEEQKDSIKEQEAYWLKEYAGRLPRMNLPLDYVRPVNRSFAGSYFNFWVGAEETAGLNALASRAGATFYMVLLAVLNVLLAKVCGQEDLIVGLTAAGRRHPALERVIGIFVNTVPLRNFPALGKCFFDFVLEVKERTLEAFENQDFQFDDLLEKLKLERDPGRNPLFDVMFTLQNQMNPRLVDDTGGSGESVDTLPGDTFAEPHTIAKFDLNFNAFEMEKRLLMSIEYSTTLFKLDTIHLLAENFKQIIVSILEDPERTISNINIASIQEEVGLLERFNDDLEME